MKYYLKPEGIYIALEDHIPVNERLILCAERPSLNYIPKTGWETDPMNPTVCWREKTRAELDAETDKEEAEMAFPDVLITVAKGFHNHENRIRALEGKPPVTLKQVIKALRKL